MEDGGGEGEEGVVGDVGGSDRGNGVWGSLEGVGGEEEVGG